MLENVFKVSGIPSYTFVKPKEYTRLLLSLRTPGRGLVVEGPSGIGKTTSIAKVLEDLNMAGIVKKLSARKENDRKEISLIPTKTSNGIVIIDDFHKLDDKTKQSIADYMKVLADEEDTESKIVVVGINKVGDSLVNFASDLNNRVDTIKFETNPDIKIAELIQNGEKSLHINIDTKEEIIKESHGSFHIAQMLCRETCLNAEILERQEELTNINTSFESTKRQLLEELGRLFFDKAKLFATGTKLRKEGRAPYLHILNWLATSNKWSIQLEQAILNFPNHKASVGQVIDKGYLAKFLTDNKDTLGDILHYDKHTRILSVEDPKFVYYIRNLSWNTFAKQVGYLSIYFDSKYDFALSFASANRALAEAIFNELTNSEIEVFYDKNEQHRILAENVEDYLAPIYSSEAKYVIVLLGPEYPRKIWTKFESDAFKGRLEGNSIIPIWFNTAMPGMFDETTRIGGIQYNEDEDMMSQVNSICETLKKKLAESRLT